MNPSGSSPSHRSSAQSSPKLPRKKSLQIVSDGRRAALEVILLLEQGAQVQAALDTYLRGASLKPQDRALCTELVYGFLRAEVRIEHILQSLLRNPRKLPREMYLALGLAVYAVLFLERIPVHATVDWTVGHVRRRFGEPMSRVANGALRAFVRQGDAPKSLDYYMPKSLPKESQAALLQRDALFYAVPLWIARLWYDAYGSTVTCALLQRSLAAPYSCVRINARSPHARELRDALLSVTSPKIVDETLSGSEICTAPLTDSSLSLALSPTVHGEAMGAWGIAFAAGTSPRSVANAPLSYWQQQGDISFQSAGSQCAMHALDPAAWPEPVWDMCAGQGGKTCLLLEQGVRVALSTDVHLSRLESFTGNMQRVTGAFAPCMGHAAHPEHKADSTALPLVFASDATARQGQNCIDTMQRDLNEKIYTVAYTRSEKQKTEKVTYLDDDDTDEASACVDGCPSSLPSYHTEVPLVALADGTHAPKESWKGTILIDAPCSGLGVLNRRPDIRRARDAQSLPELITLQARLLESAWNSLQAGGALIYMTCTLNPAENEEQITMLLKNHPEAQLVRHWQTPHDHPWLEGMYAAHCVKPV